MRVRVRGSLRDLVAFFGLIAQRKGRIRRASAAPVTPDPVRALSRSLHPDWLDLVVQSVRQETASARTYRLVPAGGAAVPQLPHFRAGQYLSLHFEVDGGTVCRPYSICSSPEEAGQGNYYELTIRRKAEGLVSNHVWDSWRPGTAVRSSGPLGELSYEPLRDSGELVLLAGGCGITPFRSILRDLPRSFPAVRCTLLYGVRTPQDILYFDELQALQVERPGHLRVHYVCSEGEGDGQPIARGARGASADCQFAAGFLSADFIRERIGEVSGKTFFVSGPVEMYDYLDREMAPLGLPTGRVRRDARGELADVSRRPDFPGELAGRSFRLAVRRNGQCLQVPARAAETVLVALERAALHPPAACRSGECGFCRSRLIRGQVYVIAETDRRREADRGFGYFHPCSSYPLSDLEIEVPADPSQEREETAAGAPAARR